MTKGYREFNEAKQEVKEQQIEKPKKDGKLIFITVQVIAVAVVVLFVVCAKALGGNFYSSVKEWYVKNYGEVTDVNEVLENESYFTKLLNSNIIQLNISDEKNINTMTLPVIGTKTSDFGYRVHPVNGNYLLHKGVDIAAESGTEIIAALGGTVVEKAYSSGYGNYVEIKHSDTVSTLYAHCSKVTVEEGQEIKKGEPVALVGSTGVSTGPHLHFEVRINDEVIDPQLVCDLG